MSRACRTHQFITAVMYTSRYRIGGISKLVYTTAACLPHAPRPGKVVAGACWHGLGLHGRYRGAQTGRLQKIRVCLGHRPVDDSLFSEVHHREKTDMYGLCTRHARVSGSVGLFELHDGFHSSHRP